MSGCCNEIAVRRRIGISTILTRLRFLRETWLSRCVPFLYAAAVASFVNLEIAGLWSTYICRLYGCNLGATSERVPTLHERLNVTDKTFADRGIRTPQLVTSVTKN